jgi:hypothetical protein
MIGPEGAERLRTESDQIFRIKGYPKYSGKDSRLSAAKAGTRSFVENTMW